MKKKCTNSSCRKVFSVNSFSVSCPYCGKAYPRLGDVNEMLLKTKEFRTHAQRVSAHYRDRIILRSGKRVSVAPLCVNGIYLPMGYLFKQYDEILSTGTPDDKKVPLIKALRNECLRLTGGRVVLGLMEALELYKYAIAHGYMPSEVTAAREEQKGEKVFLKDAAFSGRLSAPRLCELGKPNCRR